MKISAHSKMKWQDNPNWPPVVWTGSGTKMLVSTLDIEKSIFKKASLKRNAENSKYIQIEVEHDGRKYTAVLLCDDPVFLKPLCDLLNKNSNKSLSEIGDLEIPF